MDEPQYLHYLIGSALDPVDAEEFGHESGAKIIAHIVNDIGAFGKGFVVALSKKWKQPERYYRERQPRVLGTVARIKVQDDPLIYVANIVGQSGIKARNGVPPVRYDAIRRALNELGQWVSTESVFYKRYYSLHLPRIGCGNAGGEWQRIEPILNDTLIRYKIPTFVYTLPDEIGRFEPDFGSRKESK